jgi:hypothetical protein
VYEANESDCCLLPDAKDRTNHTEAKKSVCCLLTDEIVMLVARQIMQGVCSPGLKVV